MFLNKTALITTLSLFVCSACVSINNNDTQQTQITNLQTELVQVKKTNQQTQSELTALNNTLTTCQNRVEELASLLKKTQQENRKKAATTDRQVAKWDDKTIFGQTEWVYVTTAKSNYRARIDTGAATSSINATDIERFERDGKKWVRFNLSHRKGLKPQIIEAKIKRFAKILQSGNANLTTSRPVVKLHVRIGDITYPTEFTLTDRSLPTDERASKS